MSNIENALVVSWFALSIFGIYAVSWRIELQKLRKNEQAKLEIAQNDSLDGRLIRNSNAYYKID